MSVEILEQAKKKPMPEREQPTIYVIQDGEYLGPYTEKEVRRHWANGLLRHGDFVWQDGMGEWIRLETYFGIPAPVIAQTLNGGKNGQGQRSPVTQPVLFDPPGNLPEGFEYQTHPSVSAGWLIFLCWTSLGAGILVAAVYHHKPVYVLAAAGVSAFLCLIQVLRLRNAGSIGMLVASLAIPALVWCLAVSLLTPPLPVEPGMEHNVDVPTNDSALIK
ncbi:MAG: DUF4339 domain-containing protein [Bacteroidia bacterium]|nr:DUF4339 domain-containing protein [Bacteroidia bacterium]